MSQAEDPRHRQGRQAEAVALKYLQTKGLKLLTRNYRSKRGELDLVMRDGAELVVVEVRYRRRSGYGDAAESVNRSKQQRIIAATEHFLVGHPDLNKWPVRFDVIGIDAQGGIQWLKAAFQAN